MGSLREQILYEVTADLWTALSLSEKPILMYGMGNGADKILAVLERYGVEVADFFASDGFVRGHAFHGKVVLSYSDAIQKHGKDAIILVSFGSQLPDVRERIFTLAEKHELYIPDVPVSGDSAIFTMEFFLAHAEELEFAYDRLADEESRRIFKNILLYKLTGAPKYLKASESSEEEIFQRILIKEYRGFADLGAYNGDTLAYYTARFPTVRRIFAMEPDGRNFRKLSAKIPEYSDCEITAVQAAAWNRAEVLTFTAAGNRNSSGAATGTLHGAKVVTVDALPPDDVISEAVDFIKYDVEGAEERALEGTRGVICRYRPDLLVSAYHRSEDLFRLSRKILEICPDYRLFLRRLPYFPAWDINLYGIIDKETL